MALFMLYLADLNHCDRDCMACKTIYSLTITEKICQPPVLLLIK